MDVERHLVSKVIQERTLTEVANARIAPQHFLDPANRTVYETILRHRMDHGEIPSLKVMQMDHPDYKFIEVEEPWTVLVNKIHTKYGLWVVEQGLAAVVDSHDDQDLETCQAILARTLNELATSTPASNDVDLSLTGAQRLALYESYKRQDGRLIGVPTGFHTLDQLTQGFQGGQLITMFGHPKSGKSITALHSADAANRAGFKPLFIGFEMTNAEQYSRLEAFRAGIDHAKLKGGRLNSEEMRKLKRAINLSENLPRFVFSMDTSTSVTGILGKIETNEPDVVIVDGTYFMRDELGEAPGSSQAITNITRALKALALRVNIPIICTTQGLPWKSKGEHLGVNSIGYSSSFLQDSDMVLGVEITEAPDIRVMRVLASRNFQPTDFWVRRDWKTGTVQELDGNPFHDDLTDDALYSSAF